MLERLARRYQLVLLSAWPVTWERAHIADHVLIEPDDGERIVAVAEELAGRYPIVGVLTYYEPCVELSALIGERLRVPHCPPDAARRCRDKFATREALREAGVPSARHALIGSVEEARRAAEEIGYPVVIKPRSLSASFGVSLVESPGALATALNCAESSSLTEAWSHHCGVLIEEYLDGPEISIDTVIFHGRLHPVLYAKKILGFPPNFEEIGHIVAAPELIVDEPEKINAVLEAAHRALGIDNTVTHTEIRMTASGPRVIEINGRSGGDLIPQLGELATGIDIATASGDVAAGNEPDLVVTRHGVVGVQFFYPDGAGRVTSVKLDPRFARPDWLHEVAWLLTPGAMVQAQPGRLYLDRFGFGIVTAETVNECVTRMETLERRAMVELGALTEHR